MRSSTHQSTLKQQLPNGTWRFFIVRATSRLSDLDKLIVQQPNLRYQLLYPAAILAQDASSFGEGQ